MSRADDGPERGADGTGAGSDGTVPASVSAGVDIGEPLLEVRDLVKHYDTGGLISEDPVQAVDGVSFDIRKGETIGLVGESGCGKTTLGRTILNLETATDGEVLANGTDVTSLSGEELSHWQRNAGMVFQDPDSSLNDRMTVGEIVREPLEAHDWPTLTVAVTDAADPELEGTRVSLAAPDARSPDLTVEGESVRIRENLPLTREDVELDRSGDTVSVQIRKGARALQDDRVKELLDTVGLREEHFYRYPHQFSGGQRQRVGIARALALEPEFLVLDEPVSALDVSVQARIINLLEELQDDLGLTYLFIAHDLSVVRHIADRTAVMYLGNIVEMGPTEEVFTDAAHPYTISLLSAIPGSTAGNGDRVTLRGTPPSPRDPPSGCPFSTRCPAKIRPDELDLEGRDWERLDELYAVFRARDHAEQGIIDSVKRYLGISVSEDVDEILLDIFPEATTSGRDENVDDDGVNTGLTELPLPTKAADAVHDAADQARLGDDGAAAERLREAFGSVCNEEFPDAEDVGAGRTSRCLRHDEEYDDPQAVIDERYRSDD